MSSEAMRSRAASLGAAWIALAIAVGAFGAHAIRDMVSATDMETFRTGAQYQLANGIGILALGAVGLQAKYQWRVTVALSIAILLFSGSLYALVLTGTKFWGAVTPFGGLTMIVTWSWVCLALWKGFGIERSAE